MSGHAENFPSESGSGLHKGTAYLQKPSGFASNEASKPDMKRGWILGAFIGIFFIWGIPILTNPGSASAVLLHGDAGIVGVLVFAMVGMAVLFRHLNARVDANNPGSRFAFFAKFLAAFCAVFFIILVVWLGGKERTEVRIQRNGQRAMADVVRIYTGSCGKRSCSIDVEYAFTPVSETSGASQPLHGYAQLGTSSYRNDPDVVYARANQHVPIAYEIDHPQVSALNFNDDVFRLDHGERYRSTVALLSKIFLGIFLVGLVLAGFSFGLNSGK
jgi:hypothetical protein